MLSPFVFIHLKLFGQFCKNVKTAISGLCWKPYFKEVVSDNWFLFTVNLSDQVRLTFNISTWTLLLLLWHLAGATATTFLTCQQQICSPQTCSRTIDILLSCILWQLGNVLHLSCSVAYYQNFHIKPDESMTCKQNVTRAAYKSLALWSNVYGESEFFAFFCPENR